MNVERFLEQQLNNYDEQDVQHYIVQVKTLIANEGSSVDDFTLQQLAYMAELLRRRDVIGTFVRLIARRSLEVELDKSDDEIQGFVTITPDGRNELTLKEMSADLDKLVEGLNREINKIL